MIILADECLNRNIVRELEQNGFTVQLVSETSLGVTDREVLDIGKALNGVLITEDKDFGEWVFAHHITGLTIVFLRYDKEHYADVVAFLLNTLRSLSSQEENQFITITKNKVRFRKI